MYFLTHYVKKRRVFTTLIFVAMLVTNYLLYDVREPVIILLYIATTTLLLFSIFQRTMESTLPRFNI